MNALKQYLDVLACVCTIVGVFALGMSFWWQAAFMAVFIVSLVHLCLRSRAVINVSPNIRIATSIIFIGLLIAVRWTPMREQYEKEHLPPSFVYVVPGFFSPQQTPTWYMAVHHFGPHPVYNIQLLFLDRDRQTRLAGRSQVTPGEIAAEESTLRYSEIDPSQGGQAKLFPWTPVDPDHESYGVQVVSREGTFDEDLKIERISGRFLYRITVVAPPSKQPLLDCSDPGFPASSPTRLPACFPQYTVQHQGGENVEPWPPQHLRGLALLGAITVVLLYGTFARSIVASPSKVASRDHVNAQPRRRPADSIRRARGSEHHRRG